MATTIGPALWPGSSTFPNTIVYPGQGNLPLVRVYMQLADWTLATPVLTQNYADVTARLKSWSTSRGRQTELDVFDAGTAVLLLDDADRFLDPAVHDYASPGVKIKIEAEYSSNIYPIFTGYAESWQESWDSSGKAMAQTTIAAADENKILARALLPTSGSITGTHGAEFLGQILDAVGNQAPRKFDADAGFSGPEADYPYTGQSAATAVTDIYRTSTTLGFAAYVQSDGLIRYRAHAVFSPTVYGDGGGTELPYSHLVTDFSDRFLFNDWTVNGASGSIQTASNTASILRYQRRANVLTYWADLASYPLAAGRNVAQQLSDTYNAPFLRVTALSPEMNDAETARQTLGLDIYDRVEIIHRPPGGGSPYDSLSTVQKIDLSGTPSAPMQCTLGVSPLYGAL